MSRAGDKLMAWLETAVPITDSMIYDTVCLWAYRELQAGAVYLQLSPRYFTAVCSVSRVVFGVGDRLSLTYDDRSIQVLAVPDIQDGEYRSGFTLKDVVDHGQ